MAVSTGWKRFTRRSFFTSAAASCYGTVCPMTLCSHHTNWRWLGSYQGTMVLGTRLSRDLRASRQADPIEDTMEPPELRRLGAVYHGARVTAVATCPSGSMCVA